MVLGLPLFVPFSWNSVDLIVTIGECTRQEYLNIKVISTFPFISSKKDMVYVSSVVEVSNKQVLYQ
jgi:hypothetical protein